MFWPEPPKDFENELRERAWPESRYLFFKRGKGFGSMESLLTGIKDTVYYGFCTHCKKQSALENRPTHNDKYTCPACGSQCVAKEDGRGTKNLYDDGGYNLIQMIDGVLYITHFYVALDYRFDKYKPDMRIEETHGKWRFTIDEAESYINHAWFDGYKNRWNYEFEKAKSIIREKFGDNYTKLTEEMFKGTWLENSRLFEYLRLTRRNSINSLIEYIAAYQKHPNIANLVDSRYIDFAEQYAAGNKSLANRLIDWRKARPHEMLRTQKEELPAFLRTAKVNLEAALFYQKTRLAGQRLTEHQLQTLLSSSSCFDERPMKDAIKRKRIPKALNYIERQYGITKPNHQHWHRYGVITMWRDYLNECGMLGYDLNDDSIYYPPDLEKAHNRTMKLIKIQEDEAAIAAAKKRVDKLRWLTWEDGGLIIRPAASVNELKDEGKNLSHCVGGYAQRYLSGQTAIFFVRKADEPEKSWFTLELDEKNFKVRQNRGKHNCDPPEKVKQFVEQWLKWIPEEKARLKKAEKEKAA